MDGMDVEWGPESAWGSGPRLDEFLLALPYAGHHDYRPEWRP